jgi:hypothetical protein
MAVFDLFSRRRDAAMSAGSADVFTYDELPLKLRNQLVMIWEEHVTRGQSNRVWEYIESILKKEFGFLDWPQPSTYLDTAMARVCTFFVSESSTHDQRLDIVDLIMGYLVRRQVAYEGQKKNDMGAVDEVNVRFQQSGIGYRIEGDQLIRVDSTFAHAEIIKPALTLLGRKGFEKVDEHFRAAYKHYLHDEYAQTINEAGKAFEAALKAICKAENWEYAPGATAGNLVTTVVKNGLFPAWLEEGLTAYVAMMKTGLPGVRNQTTAAHGAAPDAGPVQGYFARYALHLSATNLL